MESPRWRAVPPFRLMQAAAQHMSQGGRIANIGTSILGMAGMLPIGVMAVRLGAAVGYLSGRLTA